jgi:hypothetical protein
MARAGRERSRCRARAAHSARRPNSVESPSAPPPPDAGAAVTESVTDVDGEVPAALEQASAYESVPTAVGLTVWEPLLAKAPDQLPDAVQPEAFEEDQVMVVEVPLTMVLEARVNVGAAGGGPVTVRVFEVGCELPLELEHTIV